MRMRRPDLQFLQSLRSEMRSCLQLLRSKMRPGVQRLRSEVRSLHPDRRSSSQLRTA